MAFTKQHYEQVAAIARGYHILTITTWMDETGKKALPFDFLDDLAEMFTEDNPRFDRERFLLACGVHEDDVE